MKKALDDNREATLQAYISNIRDLLQKQKSTSLIPGHARQVARAQTLNTLRYLDANRNKIVFQFLRNGGLGNGGLVSEQNPVIDLRNTDLSNDNLSGVDLSGINLNGATMIGAHLDGANMSGDSLYGTDLSSTDLSGADLSRAFMFDARLNDARLSGADLSYATLTGAFLGGTNMNGAILTGAHLNGAILTGAQLAGAHLSDANLLNADLTGATLTGADLSDTDLVSNLTQLQLDHASSCANASLSKGITCQPTCTFAHTVLICQPKPPVQLTYWYTESPAETPVILNLISQFEQENPGIRIKAENTNYYQAETKFTNAFKEGSAPDVLRSDVGWVVQFASQGYLLDINPYIGLNINPHINPYIHVHLQGRSGYLRTALSYDYYYNSSDHYYGLYGLPQVTDFLVLLYNKKEVYKAERTISPPATMDKFKTYAEDVVRRGAAEYGFETDGTSYNTLPFLYAFGGGMLDQRGNIIVNHRGSMKGLEFLVGLEHDSRPQVMPTNVNFTNGPPGPVISDFARGKTAMIFGGPYNISDILHGRSFKDPGNLGIARIPGCPAGTATCWAGQPGSPSGGQSYVISASTAHPVEAYKFIAFMSSERSQIAIAKANKTLPTLMNAYQDNAVKKIPFISEFLCIEYTAAARPAIPQSGHLFDVFDPHIAAALDGVESPTAALNAVAEAWKKLLPGTAVTPSKAVTPGGGQVACPKRKSGQNRLGRSGVIELTINNVRRANILNEHEKVQQPLGSRAVVIMPVPSLLRLTLISTTRRCQPTRSEIPARRHGRR